MIGLLVGVVHDGDVILTSGGVGYRVEAPQHLTAGDHVTLVVETVVRDNDIRLYGFEDDMARTVFRALCKVPGVGPAAALAVLRELGVAGLANAVAAGDVGAVTRARGVGRKAASSILAGVNLPEGIDTTAATPPSRGIVTEVAEALTGLGFPTGAADAAAQAAAAELPDGDDNAVMSRALQLVQAGDAA
jgi:holliday junction DNA helicase RuvA